MRSQHSSAIASTAEQRSIATMSDMHNWSHRSLTIATSVPQQKPPRYIAAPPAEGMLNAGSTPTRWPVPVKPCRIPVPIAAQGPRLAMPRAGNCCCCCCCCCGDLLLLMVPLSAASGVVIL
eukprot:12034-Heterococcus_DN1.PRE.2